MKIITLDFESHWAADYSLSKMSPLEYVMDDRFQAISVAIKFDHHPTDVFFGPDDVARVLANIDWRDKAVLAHNMSGFDSYVLAYRFGVRPKLWLCTLAMARPIHAKDVGLGLGKLVEHYGLGKKDSTILTNTRGKRFEDFTGTELAAMERYNREDTDQCRALFDILKWNYSTPELWQIDTIIRMRTEPQFELDFGLLETAASIERSRKHKALLDLAKSLRAVPDAPADFDVAEGTINWHDEGAVSEFVRGELASSQKFSELLKRLGVDTPMKPSPTDPTRQVPALAKTDEAFIALQEHANDVVAAAARARLDVKSTLLETRIEKFVTAGRLAGGRLPIPIRYCGADTTGRDSGEEYNPQNLPRINPDKPKPSDALRRSLRAPKGYKVGVADQSGIELRVNHFLWKVPSSMALYQASPDKADLYRAFASVYFKKQPEEVSKTERQFGKVCIAEGQLVLTHNGLKPIESVSVLDLVWDGVEWVAHDGPIYKGERDVIEYQGLTATPDHEVWVEDGRKVQLWYAAAQLLRLARTGSGGLPVGFGGAGVEGDRASLGAQVRPGALHGLSDREVGFVRQLAGRENPGLPVLSAEVWGPALAAESPGGSQATLHEPQGPWLSALRRTWDRLGLFQRGRGGSLGDGEPGSGSLEGAGPEGQQPGVRAGQLEVGHAAAERGQQAALAHHTVPHVQAEPPAGAVRGHHPAPHDVAGAHGRGDSAAVGHPELQAKRRVWDLLNAGPRHRFTVSGVLVSNCHLGLGFGAGAKTFQRVAKIMGGIVLAEDEAVAAVESWRAVHGEIPDGWRKCGEALFHIREGKEYSIDPWGLTHTSRHGIHLPSGRIIRYPDLRQEDDGEWPDGRPKKSWFYAQGRHKARLTGPKVDENIVQALARDSVFDCAIDFYRLTGSRPALRVHDELVYVWPEAAAQERLNILQTTMRTSPRWWKELVVWSEGDLADTYGDAK